MMDLRQIPLYDTLKDHLPMAYFLGQLLYDDRDKPDDFLLLDANESFARLIHSNPDEIANQRASLFFEPNWVTHYAHAVRTGQPVRFREYGKMLRLWFEGVSFPAGEGRFMVIFSDICAQADAEEEHTRCGSFLSNETAELEETHTALKASEEKYKTLFRYIDEGFFVSEVLFDENGRAVDIFHVEANDASKRILGRDFTGKRLTEIDPRYDQHWFDIFGEVVRTGRNMRLTKYSTPDEKWIECYIFRIGGADSKRVGHLFTDVTERIRLEMALKDSEERYRELFESMSEGFMIGELVQAGPEQPADYRIVDVNRAFSQLTGHKPEETIGRLSREMHTADAQEWIAPVLSVALSGKPGQVAFYSGALSRYYECTVFSLRAGRFAMALRDVTERKRAEATILQRNTILREINRVYEQAMLCSTVEQLGEACLRIVNDATQSKMSMIAALNDNGFINDITMRTGSDSAMMIDSHGTRAMKAHCKLDSLCSTVVQGGASLLVNDPQRYAEEQSLPVGHPAVHNFLGVPFRQNGRVAGLIAVTNRTGGYTDGERELLEAITPTILEVLLRKRAEQDRERQAGELRRMQENLTAEMEALRRLHEINANFIRRDDMQAIYEDILSAAIELTRADDGDIQFPDAHGQLCLAARRHDGEPFHSSVHCVAGENAPCKAAYAGRRRVILQAAPDGCTVNGERTDDFLLNAGIACIQSTPMFSSTGGLVGVLTTHYRQPHTFNDRELRILDLLTREAADVVERIKTETELYMQAGLLAQQAAELEKKNGLVTDFFINISHEFKTPLTILMLGTDLLEKKLKSRGDAGADIYKNLAMMKQNSYRLGRLVSNLLDITRLDAGFMEPNWELVDVVELVRNLASSTAVFARQKELELRFECDCEHKLIITDSLMLERILLNLLSNAIKHTLAGGLIELHCSAAGAQTVFRVKDNGEGIPPDKQDIIFDRFRQVNTSLTRQSEGCGIGLSLTKSLVELMGGKISFTSATGVGTEFTVTLPNSNRGQQTHCIEQSSLQLEKRVQMEFSDIAVDLS